MAVHALQRGQISRPQQTNNTVVRFPAPIGGIDSRISLTNPDPTVCVYTFNMVPFEYGMAVRKGYREWQLNVNNGNFLGIHTMIPYDGLPVDQTDDRLFAVTNEGIWDVTVATAAPILKLSFIDDSVNAGYGVYTQYVTDADEQLLFYADSKNGLFTYDPQTDTWAQTTGITGPVIENVRFIVSHKQRLWLVEEDSAKAWYLPIRSIAGAAVEFFFGSKFKHGGNLAGLFNWSVDGGDGVDDYLVGVSRSGDVLPYRGTDPTDANTWQLQGTFFVGEIPAGPFFATETGGEMYILSNFGLNSMNELLQGVDSSVLRKDQIQGNVTGKITGILRERLENTKGDFGWAVRVIPAEGGILISSPRVQSGDFIQFYYNFSTNAWGIWRGVPIEAFEIWKSDVVFGSPLGNIYIMDVFVDNVLITPPVDVANGVPIEFSLLTSYLPLTQEGVYKRVKLIRPDFLARSKPEFSVLARYDYDLTEAILSITEPTENDGIWDISLWDIAIWGASDSQAFNNILGTWGTGRYIAIAMVGKTRDFTRLIGWDVVLDTGGIMI